MLCHKAMSVLAAYLILISIDIYYFFFFVFSLVLVSITSQVYQTLKKVFDLTFKPVEVDQKHPAERRHFNSLLGVVQHGLKCTGSKCRKTKSCDLVSLSILWLRSAIFWPILNQFQGHATSRFLSKIGAAQVYIRGDFCININRFKSKLQ